MLEQEGRSDKVGTKAKPPTGSIPGRLKEKGSVPMSETLPEEIVAPLMGMARAVTAWAWEHPDVALAEMEEAILAASRAALPAVLEAVVRRTARSLRARSAPPPRACPTCGEPCRVQSWRPRQVETRCGAVSIERPWYTCRRCRHGWSPTDQTLGLAPHQRLSQGVHDQVVRLGAMATFREAAELLERLTGTVVAPETVRAHTEAAGAALEARQQGQVAQVEHTREAAEAVEAAPGTLVVETDGVMVRYQDGWHEVKLGVVGGQVDGELQELSYVAAREGPDRFGPRLLTEAARRGALEVVDWEDPRLDLARLRLVTVLGDGAVWIWRLADEHFATRIEIVDFFHASKHLWTLAHALFGAETEEAAAWADLQINLLWDHGGEALLPVLAPLTPPTDQAAETLRQEQGYFRSNALRMDYPRFRALGLPCGSGAVESAAKHLVQQRMKRSGARWSEPGAQSLLTLRTHLLSHRPLVA